MGSFNWFHYCCHKETIENTHHGKQRGRGIPPSIAQSLGGTHRHSWRARWKLNTWHRALPLEQGCVKPWSFQTLGEGTALLPQNWELHSLPPFHGVQWVFLLFFFTMVLVATIYELLPLVAGVLHSTSLSRDLPAFAFAGFANPAWDSPS